MENKEILDFLKANKELFQDSPENINWEEVYKKVRFELEESTGEFTEIIFQADIHPENYMEEIPHYFLQRSGIKEFTIPNNVTTIRDDAFRECIRLTNVTIGNSVTYICYGAFRDCSALKSMVIPDSITCIHGSTFSGCSALTSVTIPNSVTEIEVSAFSGCTSLTDIMIPYNVTKIGADAFCNCLNLSRIIIKNPKIKLGHDVCRNCSNLNIQFNGTIDEWKVISKGKFSYVTYICTCSDGVLKKLR